MKMGKNDPRSSMSKSVKGKSPLHPTGRNPIKSASPYETPGVGECCAPKRPSTPSATPKPDPIAEDGAAEG